MSKIILHGQIRVPESTLSSVIDELTTHKALTDQEPGCLLFEVNQDEHEPTIFHVYEEFADKASFEAHQERVNDSDWAKVTADAERYYQIVS